MNNTWTLKLGGEITCYFLMTNYMDRRQTSISRPEKKIKIITFTTMSKITQFNLRLIMMDWYPTQNMNLGENLIHVCGKTIILSFEILGNISFKVPNSIDPYSWYRLVYSVPEIKNPKGSILPIPVVVFNKSGMEIILYICNGSKVNKHWLTSTFWSSNQTLSTRTLYLIQKHHMLP